MGSESAQDYMYAGLYYQNGTNYNWYDPATGLTGIQATPKWDDTQPVLSFEGQDLHYSGVQEDASHCLYYPPEYAYTQSAYDPYLASQYQLNSVVGPDSSLLGSQVMQQYLTNPPYNHTQPVPSPSFSPLVVPSGTDFGSVTTPLYQHGSIETLHYNNYLGPVATLARAIVPSQRSSPGTTAVTGMPKSNSSLDFQPTAKTPKAPVLGLPPGKQSLQRTGTASAVPHANQVTNHSAPVKALSQDKSTRPVHPVNTGMGATQAGSETRNWGRVKTFWGTSSITVKSYSSKLSAGDSLGNIVIHVNNYNKADFLTDYSCAKFFVIKSYSEDDVHKSIKYGVWSSTPNGNRKLSLAYEEAQRISAKNGIKCPIFLFFSVNGSGHFCGVAEMVGPVDFDKDIDLWLQDKWPGSFPVKWHIIKDVANNTLRHIPLENNEFKPVTHSRDTQEIPFTPGMAILKIFKSHAFGDSILDEFLKYEEEERNNHRKRTKLLSSDAPVFIPTFVRNVAMGPKEPRVASEKKQEEKSSANPNSMAGAVPTVVCREHVPVKLPGEIGVKDSLLKGNANPNLVVRELPVEELVMLKKEVNKQESCSVFKVNIKAGENGNLNFQSEKSMKPVPSTVYKVKSKAVENGKNQSNPLDRIENVAEKIGSLSIKSCEVNGENGRSSGEADVVTIGSMHVRVKSTDEK